MLTMHQQRVSDPLVELKPLAALSGEEGRGRRGTNIQKFPPQPHPPCFHVDVWRDYETQNVELYSRLDVEAVSDGVRRGMV